LKDFKATQLLHSFKIISFWSDTIASSLQKNLRYEVTQSLHCFKMMVLEATQSLQSLLVQGFKATQSLHQCKNDVLERKNHKIA
jgi:hypothetical protein